MCIRDRAHAEAVAAQTAAEAGWPACGSIFLQLQQCRLPAQHLCCIDRQRCCGLVHVKGWSKAMRLVPFDVGTVTATGRQCSPLAGSSLIFRFLQQRPSSGALSLQGSKFTLQGSLLSSLLVATTYMLLRTATCMHHWGKESWCVPVVTTVLLTDEENHIFWV